MGDWDGGVFTAMRKTDSEREAAAKRMGLSSMLCEGPEGRMRQREGSPRGRGHMDAHS